MVSYRHNQLLSSGHSVSQNPFQSDYEDGSSSQGQSSILDNGKQELCNASNTSGNVDGKDSNAKALAALKNHSEAEKRRRERINVHLASLRHLLPSAEKMDKASLLAEAINHLKLLKKSAMEATQGLLMPTDEDEVRVESYEGETKDGTLLFKASVCCSYRPGILSEIRRAIDSLQLKMVNAEITTLDGRLMNVLFFTAWNLTESWQTIANSIKQVLSAVVERGSASHAYCPRTSSNKKRRISFMELSASTS